MTALTAAEKNLIKSAYIRSCRVKFWRFSPPQDGGADVNFTIDLLTDTNRIIEPDSGSSYYRGVVLVSPQYALLVPGESVSLSATDSYKESATRPFLSGEFTWSLVSGSAILSPSGATCTVTPIGGENTEVIVRCAVPTVSTNGATNYRDVRIAVSTEGWAVPTGEVKIDGNFGQRGWSGSVEVYGNTIDGLEKGDFILIHIDTYYDGVKYTFGGYRRAENLCVLCVKDWDYEDDPSGRKVCRIQLVSPAEYLDGFKSYIKGTNSEGYQGPALAETGGGYSNYFQFTHDDPTASIMTYTLATWTAVSKHFNVTLFDDSRSVASLWCDLAGIWEQLWSPIESVLGVALCNFEGSLMFIPHPAVRADEWWGTPSPRWEASSPLTLDYCNRKIKYYPDYHTSGRAWTGLTIKGFDATGRAREAHAGAFSVADLVFEGYGGYILTGDALEATWAADLLAYKNRLWDVETELYCIGNALNVGDFAYMDLPPEQDDQPSVAGLAYCEAISHRIDIGRRMQWTTAAWSQLTGSIA